VGDLQVLAAPAELLAVWAPHDEPQAAAYTRAISATGVSHSDPAGHQRFSTSALVQASNTAWVGALKVRSSRSTMPSGGVGSLAARVADGHLALLVRRRRLLDAEPVCPGRRLAVVQQRQ
jgi:hypothetical protein